MSLLLHLSDLHLSRFHRDSRAEDMEAFSQQLLSLWRPDGVVITGDLVDAKTPHDRAEQQKSEWRVGGRGGRAGGRGAGDRAMGGGIEALWVLWVAGQGCACLGEVTFFLPAARSVCSPPPARPLAPG